MQPPNEVNPFAPPLAELEGVPTGPVGDQPRAPRGERFAGAFIDGLLVIVCVVPFVFAGVIGRGGESSMMWIVIAGLCALALFSYQWYLTATTGQTIGKRSQKTKVVKEDGSPVTFFSGVFMRSWVPLFIIFLLAFVGTLAGLDKAIVEMPGRLFSLVDAICIFGAGHHCLHDLIAGTKVISVRGTWR